MSETPIALAVFMNARQKIDSYNALPKAKEYNLAYHEILDARKGRISLVDQNCSICDEALSLIEKGLLAFDMGRQMDESFKERLRSKLDEGRASEAMKRVLPYTITSQIDSIEADAKLLFENLASDVDGLSTRGDRFSVGATKILNFMFPELFVIADHWVMQGLNRTNPLDSKEYWNIMAVCRRAIEDWQRKHGSLKSLIDLDNKPTTLTRIFDKCVFVMGKCGNTLSPGEMSTVRIKASSVQSSTNWRNI